MQILGIDFTSAPSRKKPITCAESEMNTGALHIQGVSELINFSQFESKLAQPGPWIAGLDFPFGQSLRLITNLKWPESWASYVSKVSHLSKEEFITLLENYKENRPKGDKEHRREIDVLASSISPQKLYGVPVGKMFYEGAKRILSCNADIVPVHRITSDRIIVEAYPAIVARRFIAKRSYKNDTVKKQTAELEEARREIVDGILSNVFEGIYGYSITMSDLLKKHLVDDAAGDALDAVLCAAQAGWAYINRENGYGIPAGANASEGWIADPKFCGGSQ